MGGLTPTIYSSGFYVKHFVDCVDFLRYNKSPQHPSPTTPEFLLHTILFYQALLPVSIHDLPYRCFLNVPPLVVHYTEMVTSNHLYHHHFFACTTERVNQIPCLTGS